MAYDPGKQNATCPNCGNNWNPSTYRNNEEVTCPNCYSILIILYKDGRVRVIDTGKSK